jgi:aminoglycoside 6'-N-acetyltransferase
MSVVMAGLGYDFRRAERADLPMLAEWLRSPEAVRWWGDPVVEYGLLEEDLNEPLMTMQIVSFDGRPFAYAQDHDVRSWPQEQFAELPKGSRAIDSFIGVAEMVGRGHGQRYLRLLAERLRSEGAPVVAIDPAANNARARRAYSQAGFREVGMFEDAKGWAVLMLFED